MSAAEPGSMQATPVEEKEPKRRFFFGDIFKAGRYEPLHGELFSAGVAAQWKKWLSPEFEKVLAAAQSGDVRTALLEEAPGVYSFPLFTEEFCDILLAEVEHAQSTSREELERPNGMNRYGIVLNQLGLEPLITALQQEYLLPLQGGLFPEEGSEADDHHCFIVRYKAGEDVGLDMHEDDADVTLNVCLGKEFEAATLSFCGLAADLDHRKLKHTYQHQKGRAVVHLGRHRHGADNIASGERVNFILWSTSSKYRASEAYKLHRMRSAAAEPPDSICLSYTHDRDYTAHLPKLSRADAIARGVMLDVVEKRHEVYQRPVHDLTRPLEEINSVPSVCLFIEGLPPQRQHALFTDLMHVAQDILSQFEVPTHKAPPLLFFVAVQPAGAVPQVRGLCGAMSSPALVVLDIDKEHCHRFTGGEVSAESIKQFVESFLAGKLTPEPLGESGGDQPEQREQSQRAPPACEEQPTGGASQPAGKTPLADSASPADSADDAQRRAEMDAASEGDSPDAKRSRCSVL